MKKRQIQKHLMEAAESITPDIIDRLEFDTSNKNNETNYEVGELFPEKQSRKLAAVVSACVLLFLLLIVLIMAFIMR